MLLKFEVLGRGNLEILWRGLETLEVPTVAAVNGEVRSLEMEGTDQVVG